jgi:cell wall-associated NlpC family hydrolase
MAELETQPDAVLSATQDERLESLLKEFGPSDPFASLPFLSVDELKPGDIILRRSSALSSQMTELMIWSPYTHSALYVGDGMIIDSTWEYGVKTRSLADLLDESIRVSVLRLQGLTSDQAEMVVLAAQSKESAEYNFENVKLLGAQKLDALTNVSRQSLGEMIGVLGRAEYLLDATDNGKFACSELIVFAFKAADITLSQASGFTPGDMVRLGQAGFLSEVGRLQVPAIE